MSQNPFDFDPAVTPGQRSQHPPAERRGPAGWLPVITVLLAVIAGLIGWQVYSAREDRAEARDKQEMKALTSEMDSLLDERAALREGPNQNPARLRAVEDRLNVVQQKRGDLYERHPHWPVGSGR